MRGQARRVAGSLFASALVLLAPLGTRAGGVSPGGGSSLGALVLPAVGPGYVVLSQGPIDPGTFASSAPDPSAVSSALSNLSGRVSSYQRTWTDAARSNAVQDMLFHFPSAGSAQIFLQSARSSLRSGKIVSSGALPGVPGAERVTYFGATDEAGVGQAITLRSGSDVAILSFFSASAGNADPITQSDATEVTVAQQRALSSGATSTVSDTQHGPGLGGWLVLGVVAALVLVVLLAGLARVQRRRARGVPIDTPPT
jgi:hypothetical protein